MSAEQDTAMYDQPDPAGDWRDDADNISDTDTVEVDWVVLAKNGSVMMSTDFTLTASQARQILMMLSTTEES